MAQLWRSAGRRWRATSWPDVEVCDLQRSTAGGGAALFRMRAGAVITEHNHPRGEHTYVIAGEATFGPHHVVAGDALFTEPGEVHEVRAITDVVFIGVSA